VTTEQTTDDLTEAQIQRMAEKLLSGWQPASPLAGLDPQEVRMAQRLLGRSNTERLASTRRDQRFRYQRPVHKIEYYRSAYGGWTIDLLENGKRQTFKADLSDSQLGIVLAAIKKKGVPVRIFETEGEKQLRLERERRLETNPTIKVRPKSERFHLLHEVKDFRP